MLPQSIFSDPTINLIVSAVISAVIVSPVLWLAGRALVGKEKAKFTDAFLIVVIGIIVNYIVGYLLSASDFITDFYSGIVALIIQVILWLAIVKHFFDCGWLKALAITILTIIFFILILIILGIVGLAVLWLVFI